MRIELTAGCVDTPADRSTSRGVSSGQLALGLGRTLPQMLQRLLRGGDLTEPGPILCLGQACFGIGRHLLDARQLGGIDSQEPAPATDCVLDGELLVWTGERMDFGALQQRMVNTAATVRRRLAPARPASLVVFRRALGRERRRAADALDSASWPAGESRGDVASPLQLSPVTADVDEAREWLEAFKPSGVEGLVVKGATSRAAANG